MYPGADYAGKWFGYVGPFVTMLILFGILKALGMLRVHAHEEVEGLDTVEHGMPAYGHDGGGMASASFQGSAAQA